MSRFFKGKSEDVLYVNYLWYMIPVCYAAIQSLELIALLARIAGVERDSIMLGYAVQQSIYMGTRLFLLLMLPALGYLVDAGITLSEFRQLMHVSLALAGLGGLCILIFVRSFIRYQSRVIQMLKENSSMIPAFIISFSSSTQVSQTVWSPMSYFPSRNSIAPFLLSALVYWVYSVGSILTFYVALLFPENRATLTQLSGAVNALAAVLLTLIVEPRVSRSIDERSADSIALIMAMFWGRLVSVIILGQVAILLLPR